MVENKRSPEQVFKKNIFYVLTGKPTGKRRLGRRRRRWQINIGIDPKEIGITTRNWIDSTQDRDCWRAHMNSALNLRVS